jgi:GST-like protein
MGDDEQMSYTLYGTRGSGSAAVEMAFRACGVAWTGVEAASWQPDSAIQQLSRVNPLLQVPTVQLPDGSVLTESAAILLHLALTFPEARLLPERSGAQAQALRGLVFIAANCYAAVGIVDFPARWTTQPAHDAVRDAARQRLLRYWDIFADSFVAQPYLSGELPGALDFLALVVSMWCDARGHIAVSRPALAEALVRIASHERVRPTFRGHWPEA